MSRAKCVGFPDAALQVEATVELPDFKGGKDFNEKLTRAKFEELCMDLFKKTLLPVEKVLQVTALRGKGVSCHVTCLPGCRFIEASSG